MEVEHYLEEDGNGIKVIILTEAVSQNLICIAARKFRRIEESFIPLSRRAYCDCGKDRNNDGRLVQSTMTRRSERYGGTSVRLSNVSQCI